MNKSLFFFFMLVPILCFSKGYEWIDQQISEDLSYLSNHPVSASELRSWFNQLSDQGYQVLYCKIRKNQPYWQKSVRTDENRNQWVFRCFEKLSQKYSLPRTEFLLLTEDSASEMPLPIFAFTKGKGARNVCLIPDFEISCELNNPKRNWILKTKKFAKKYPWSTKENKAFFRGAGTGPIDNSLHDLGNDRIRVVLFSYFHPNLVDAALDRLFDSHAQELYSSLNKQLQCVPVVDHFKYKYLLDIDGNSCTYSRCRWILLSNSVLVKILSQNVQWYYHALTPWVHYVPIQQDLSDLAENLMYLQNNDDVAYRIAVQGRRIGKKVFSEKAVQRYLLYLIKRYSTYVHIPE